jgi:hypothetical protein
MEAGHHDIISLELAFMDSESGNKGDRFRSITAFYITGYSILIGEHSSSHTLLSLLTPKFYSSSINQHLEPCEPILKGLQ